MTLILWSNAQRNNPKCVMCRGCELINTNLFLALTLFVLLILISQITERFLSLILNKQETTISVSGNDLSSVSSMCGRIIYQNIYSVNVQHVYKHFILFWGWFPWCTIAKIYYTYKWYDILKWLAKCIDIMIS